MELNKNIDIYIIVDCNRLCLVIIFKFAPPQHFVINILLNYVKLLSSNVNFYYTFIII